FVMEFLPPAATAGMGRYHSNRTPATVLEADYTATVSDDRVVIRQNATTTVEGDGNVNFGQAEFVISANARGKAAVTGLTAEWWQDPQPFLIKANS
ncbi:MAG: hypothetical protein K2L16_08925, partial [Muribaculaceae bacterium]|nr:hypothetical protein [Muribaculaceae bacterium]